MPTPSAALLARLKLSEGFRAEPYLCPAGRVTIGYGHNLEAHPLPIADYDRSLADRVSAGALRGEALLARLRKLGMRWDERTADAWLRAHVSNLMDALGARCPAYRALIAAGTPAARARAEVLVDMAYNLGPDGLLKFVNTLAAVERGDYARAAAGMLASKWAGQVGRRARVLAEIMRIGVIVDDEGAR